jgi:hypothetical protein
MRKVILSTFSTLDESDAAQGFVIGTYEPAGELGTGSSA